MPCRFDAPSKAPVRDEQLDRQFLIQWYRRNRTRSAALFDLLADDAYYSRPIALRHPVAFYEGHLPAFSFNTLVKQALGGPSIDPDLEVLFARGIDPPDEARAAVSEGPKWPARDAIARFADEADRRVEEALEHGDILRPGHPFLHRAEAVFCILEHEAMHQETLLYMWHRLPFEQKRRPADYRPEAPEACLENTWTAVEGGRAVLGTDPEDQRFSWDNERPAHAVTVGDFLMQRFNVTNGAFRTFIDAGGYQDARWWDPADWSWVTGEGIRHPAFWRLRDGRWWWRGMFDFIPLPLSWPVYVSHAEAAAYARWLGARLPTEAEYQRAAFGSADGACRPYPWGHAHPSAKRGIFDFGSWDPQPVGSRPAGASAWGIHDLVGNGWEWTSSVFTPFPGFAALPAYPQYSTDFFDGEHFVLKGASPATARELLRPSFRNWFRHRYPYVYASFRCVRG
jgi:ergothioneine biosynthesis protein EgtB